MAKTAQPNRKKEPAKPPPATYKGTVQSWHCDHMGHMNVMFYVGKFDEGTWNFLSSLGLGRDYFTEHHCGMAAVQQNISYKRELMAGDGIEIRTRLLEMRERVLKFEHTMLDLASGEVSAICEITAVHIDRRARKSIPFPDPIRKLVEAR